MFTEQSLWEERAGISIDGKWVSMKQLEKMVGFYTATRAARELSGASSALGRSQRNYLGFLLLTFASIFALAGVASAQNVMIRTDTCTGFDANMDGFLIKGRSVLLKTRSGTEVYQCTGWMPSEAVLPDRTITYTFANTNGTPCNLSLFDGRFGSTNNWRMTVTPSGHVTLTCRPSHQ